MNIIYKIIKSIIIILLIAYHTLISLLVFLTSTDGWNYVFLLLFIMGLLATILETITLIFDIKEHLKEGKNV